MLCRAAIELFDLLRCQVRGAMHDLAGEHFRGEGQVTGNLDFRTDIAAEDFGRHAFGVEGRRRTQNGLDDAFQHLAIEVFLGFEVVIDVGLGDTGFGRDIAGLAGGEALVGEFLAGSAQDEFFVALADTAHDPVVPLPAWRSRMLAPGLRSAQS